MIIFVYKINKYILWNSESNLPEILSLKFTASILLRTIYNQLKSPAKLKRNSCWNRMTHCLMIHNCLIYI